MPFSLPRVIQTLSVMRSWFAACVGSAEADLLKLIAGPVQIVEAPAMIGRPNWANTTRPGNRTDSSDGRVRVGNGFERAIEFKQEQNSGGFIGPWGLESYLFFGLKLCGWWHGGRRNSPMAPKIALCTPR